MATTIRLTVEDGTLYVDSRMLLRVYAAGDCDTCTWPADYSIPELRERLACALFDAREMSPGFGYDDAIELPDGQAFPFDEYVS